MARAEWPVVVDGHLRRDLEALLQEVRARFRCDEYDEGKLVTYNVETSVGSHLTLSIDLLPDQLNLNCGGCAVLIELAAHHPKFGINPRAFEDWRARCLSSVRAVLTSDLRVETRSRGDRVLGGYLWRREGSNWVPCGGGGDIMMFLGRKHVTEYHDWLAREDRAL